MSSAKIFVSRRKPLALTEKRISDIVRYIIFCYLKLKSDKVVYSRALVKASTSIMFEDYLKIRFVEDYLIPLKNTYSSSPSPIEDLIFTYESNKTYISTIGKEQVDKIDICVLNLGLESAWRGVSKDHIYYSLECKVIKILSDTSDYILDIEKFVARNHTKLRLPFEGMIAFIENPKINHRGVSSAVNGKLKPSTSIETTEYLLGKIFDSSFDGSYASTHKKSYNKNELFRIYHLLLDYSTNIVA